MIGPGARRHFLCDIENVHGRWARIAPMISRGDAVTIFVSSATGKFDPAPFTALGPKGVAFYFCECTAGRPNAMDFQIMCELGRLSMSEPNTELVIVSSDQGYDSAIPYMCARGAAVRRFDPSETLEPYALEPAAPASAIPDGRTAVLGNVLPSPKAAPANSCQTEYMVKLKAAGVDDPEDLRVTSAILYAAMQAPQNRRKVDVMNRLMRRYGAEEGRIRYLALKAVVHDIAQNGPFPEKKAAQKPDMTSDAVNRALNKQGIPLREGTVKKSMEAVLAARGTKDPTKSLSDRIETIFTKSCRKKALSVLKQFL